MSLRRHHALIGLVIGATFSGACGSPTEGPDPATPASISVEPSTARLVSIGDTIELSATVRNGSSQVISSGVVWTASPPGVVTVDANGRAVAVTNGIASVVASSGPVTGTASVTVEQVIDTVEVSGDGQGGDVLAALDSALVVVLRDARGHPVEGVPVSFSVSSGDGSATPTEVSTGPDGSASTIWTLGATAGLQELDVTAGVADEVGYRFGANGYALDAIELSLFSGDGQSELAGTALAGPIRVQVLDSLGNGVAGVSVTFESTGDATLEAAEVLTDLDGIASVGLTLGSALGPYSITADVADSLTATNTPLANSPVVFGAEAVPYSASSVTELVVGDTVSITGSGFHPDPGANSVLVGGQVAPILAGTQSELTIEVPGFGCTPQRGLPLEVSRTGEQVVQDVTVTPRGALTLAVGERRVLTLEEEFCLQFLPASDDEYLVGLTSTSWFDGGASFAMNAADSVGPFPGASSDTPSASTVARSALVLAGEAQLRAHEESLIQSLIMEEATRGRGGPSALMPPQPAPPLEGDVLSLRLPDLRGDPCLAHVPVMAEVFWVGTRLALAAPVPAPDPGHPQWSLIDAALTALQFYDQTALDLVVTLLGLPAEWDGESRVTVVFTPEVSQMGLPAYASAVDQLPRTACPSSDEGHYVYVAVPPSPTVPDLVTAMEDARPEILHHFSHIVQWTRRLAAGGNLLPSWLAEGQSEFVVEQVGLFLSALQTQTELTPGDLSGPIADWMPERFDRLARFQGWDGTTGTVPGAPEGCSVFGFGGAASPCGADGGAGAAWAFMRYLTDRFTPGAVGGEEVLHQAIVNLAPTADIVAELEEVLGAALPDLVIDFAGTLYADGRLTPEEAPLLQMYRWDLPAMIPAGPRRLTPPSFGFSDFSRSGLVVGGGTAYSLITSTGSHGPLALAVDNGAGGSLPLVLQPRLWVLRMR